MRIGIVAGEESGDYLAAGLMNSLRRRWPDAEFVGIGGPRMQAVGMESVYPMDRISIMGVDELLGNVIQILRVRRSLTKLLSTQKPDIFVGVDAPDFNLTLEEKLRDAGITTVHYVSPTVWAWRSYRIRKIRRAVSHMLTLFPFEAEYYRERNIPVSFVGHPVADELNRKYDKEQLRTQFQLHKTQFTIALLPGSRISELKRLGGLFIETAARLHANQTGLQFVAPFANTLTKEYFEDIQQNYPNVEIKVVSGHSRDVLAASDVALLASGTAALEAALLKIPMVITYKVSFLSSILVRLFAHVEYFSMPNNLLDVPVAPELIQSHATVDNLFREMSSLISSPNQREQVRNRLGDIGSMLRKNANETAADIVAELL